MDFFARQDASRRSTRRLVLIFGLAFLAVAMATAVVIGFAFGLLGNGGGVLSTTVGSPAALVPNLTMIAAITAGTLLLMIVASLYRSATLARGGGQVATMLGGTRVHGDESDPLLIRLMNVVEEMAIASGLPVPEVYVLEREQGINAFAAGLNHGDAAIAVTRGSLEQLNRAELQGVIAHEFSHVLNGDMRINVRLMGLGFGILVLSLVGRWLLRGARFSRSSRNRGGGAIVFVGLALTAIGSLGVLLSRLIKAAVSRQREVLADASAVQFTREPQALAGALKKIGGFTPYLSATETEEVSHMLFGSAGPGFRGWFATHPPLPERIRALDPSFRESDYTPPAEPRADVTTDSEQAAVSGLQPGSSLAGVTTEAAGSMSDDATARALLASIPEQLEFAAHSIDQSVLLILALALGDDAPTRSTQLGIVRARLGDRRAAACVDYRQALNKIDRRLWLPLVEITVPAIKRRPASQIDFLFDLIERLTDADSELSLFEYALIRLLRAYATPGVGLSRPAHRRQASMRDAWLRLLAVVAAFGHSDRQDAAAAFSAGAASVPAAGAADGVFAGIADAPDLHELDKALTILNAAPSRAKRDVIASVETTIRHDGDIRVEEAELLRAIAASLGCPIPPARAIG